MLSDVTLSWHAEALAEVATIQQFSAPLGLFPYMQFGKKKSAQELPPVFVSSAYKTLVQ